ncbi:MAG: glutamate--tRNA ligase family protein [Gemmatimonadaceae bacterium]
MISAEAKRRWRAALAPGFVTRFAPAPTGYLHLGHVVNAVWVWGVARAFDGRVLLRIEDHDRGRCRPEYEHALLDDLDWLGLAPDGATTADFRRGPQAQRQSDNVARYAARLDELERHGLVFACDCSRATIARASDASTDELRYPGTCRDRRVDPATTPARRIRFDAAPAEEFDDLRLGARTQAPDAQCGDLLGRDRAGNYTYQFAVVVDDLEQGVDVVIRGEDLLESTGRQIRLARMLGRSTPPRFLHHPLVTHPDGSKLSKSSGDTGVRELRAAGRSAHEVLGLAAQLGGVAREATPLSPDDLAALFR